jgi:hypothetical protein
MLNSKNLKHYAFALSLVMIASYVGNKFKQNFAEQTNDEYELIRKHLLNDTPLYGFNKPKIWIHTKYEINARNWKSYGSRNSKELNQPYLHFTIQSVIDHCSDDFHICLIDDHTFSKLIPGWDVDVSKLPEPIKSQYRHLALLKLINTYGGIIVPNSFVCLSSLKPMYNAITENGKAFVSERINRTITTTKSEEYTPDTYFMGCDKNDEVISELIDMLNSKMETSHHSNEPFVTGYINIWCEKQIETNRLQLITGDKIGIRDNNNKPIIIDDLMQDKTLNISDSCIGVYIPADEMLKRNKFNWFAVLTRNQILKSKLAISYIIRQSMTNSTDFYTTHKDLYNTNNSSI